MPKSKERVLRLPEFICQICGWKWHPRRPEWPLRCAKCKSAYWQRGRRFKEPATGAAR
jgi:predicted Zn-ribbon and HTH transcriptional regulator